MIEAPARGAATWRHPLGRLPARRLGWLTLRELPLGGGIITLLVGTVVLVGWATDRPWLRHLGFTGISMKPNAAVSFLAIGAALVLVASRPSNRRLLYPLSGVPIAIGVLSIFETVAHVNLGIDQLLFRDTEPGAIAGRIAINTATAFALFGFAAAAMSSSRHRVSQAAQIATLVAASVAAMACVGYLVGTRSLYQFSQLTPMAPVTALLFLVVAAGLLQVNPAGGPMGAFLGDSDAARLRRELLPPAIVVPILAFWLRGLGQTAGLYGQSIGDWLLVLVLMGAFIVAITRSGRALERASYKRQALELERAEAELRFRQFVDTARDYAIVGLDSEGRIVQWTEGVRRVFGYDADALRGATNSLFMTPADVEAGMAATELREAEAHGSYEVETQPVRADGSVFWAHVSIRPLRDESGTLLGYTKITHDVTEARQAARAQAEAAAYARSLIEASLDPMLTIDPAGTITDVNAATLAATGASRDELIGSSYLDYFHSPDDARGGFEQVMATGSVTNLPLTVRHRDGHSIDVLANASLYNDDDGNPVGVLAVARDMSEKNRLDREIARTKRLLDRSQQISKLGGWEIDAVSGTISWTDEVYRIHGLDPSFDTNDLAQDINFYAPESVPLIEAAVGRAIAEGEQFDLELELVRVGGEQIPVRVIGAPVVEDGHVVRVEGTIVDISELRRARQEILDLNSSLEARVAIRTQELTTANEELEAFAYSVSHDLRAPLRSIDGFSQAVLDEYAGAVDETGRDYLTRLRNASQRMGVLIDDILNLSRMSRGEMTRSPVDLSELARSVSAEVQERDPSRTVEIVITNGLNAVGDARLMRIALENLFANAFKFTATTAQARIEFGCEQNTGQDVYFVRDNGVGFDMAYKDQLFVPFHRLHAGNEYPGTGIGLATVRRIIRRHGGRIWAHGEVDRGATIYFTLREEDHESD